MRRWVAGGVVGAVVLLVGCSSTDSASPTASAGSGPVPLVTASAPSTSGVTASGATASGVTTVAPLLAPSQITASTVERPSTPAPCELDVLAVWTASIVPGTVTVRIRNDGPDWCDVDISASARLDPVAEPAIWLEPGDAATLVASGAEPGCDAPTTVRSLDVDVGGVGVTVPTALSACRWRLIALYPVDPPSTVCTTDQLTVGWFELDQVLAVRHVAGAPCRLGDLGPALYERGDIVAWDGESCSGRGDLPFDSPEIDVEGVPDCRAWSAAPEGVAVVAPDLAVGLANGSIDL